VARQQAALTCIVQTKAEGWMRSNLNVSVTSCQYPNDSPYYIGTMDQVYIGPTSARCMCAVLGWYSAETWLCAARMWIYFTRFAIIFHMLCDCVGYFVHDFSIVLHNWSIVFLHYTTHGLRSEYKQCPMKKKCKVYTCVYPPLHHWPFVFYKKCTLLHECGDINVAVLSEPRTCHTMKVYRFSTMQNMSIIDIKAVKIFISGKECIYLAWRSGFMR
jgi:hypothetical protein